MKSFKKNIFRSDEDTSALCLNCSPHDVIIGTQTWTGCNANTKFYNNGDPIPYVDNPTTWQGLTTGAWCYYNNAPASEATYGILYNWYAVNDPRGLAPTGYHVPLDSEWTALISQVGGISTAGGNMKEVGLCHWTTPNTGATNTSQFTGLPGGTRNLNGSYSNIGNDGYWWSSTQFDAVSAWYRTLRFNDATANKSSGNKAVGFSLRFIKD